MSSAGYGGRDDYRRDDYGRDRRDNRPDDYRRDDYRGGGSDRGRDRDPQYRPESRERDRSQSRGRHEQDRFDEPPQMAQTRNPSDSRYASPGPRGPTPPHGTPMQMAQPMPGQPMPAHQQFLANQGRQGTFGNGQQPQFSPQPQMSVTIPGPSFLMPAGAAGALPPPGMLVPQQQPMARKKTYKQIQLTPQGNLVIDIPVADRVLQMGAIRTGEEFTHMRYTAATCDPNDFPNKGYSMRQQEYGRQTELFIVVTMYNEDDFLFAKTMHSICKNISHLCTRSKSRTWGSDGWKKVTVCIVSDGRKKVNPRVLNVLGVQGVYQDGVMKESVNGKPVSAHIFEYTSQICVDVEGNILGPSDGIVPTQIIFCLKEKNQKKINSHRWFFNAFGPLLRPNVCVLIDVGTKPSGTSLYHLWKTFDRDPSVGGACGEIYAELGKGCSNLLNPLVAAQNFEYKISNILDKPLESVFGYISVLPGAFSAYRYVALQGKPLQMYFHGESMHGGADIFAANMYLAEDRILCFELVTKETQAWVLRYVKAAKAETDVPDSVPEFISQRRRWLNGSFFAGVHALTHWYFLFRSGHSLPRKLWLCVEFTYNLIQLIFNWFALANFYLSFYFLLAGRVSTSEARAKTTNDPFFGYGQQVFFALQGFYIFAMLLILICAFGNRPQGSKWVYTASMALFALIMAVVLYVSGYTVYLALPQSLAEWKQIGNMILNRQVFRDIVISFASTYALYFFASFVYLEPWHMFTSFVQYMFLMPSFINILQVYAFANLHDVSWGTKGDNGGESDLAAVTVTKGKDGKMQVDFEMPTDKNDINNNYERFLKELKVPRPPDNKKRDAKTKQEDYFKNFRTKVVMFWLVSNLGLIALLTSDYLYNFLFARFSDPTQSFNPYLTFIFYSVAGLAFIRFCGSMGYLVHNMICG